MRLFIALALTLSLALACARASGATQRTCSPPSHEPPPLQLEDDLSQAVSLNKGYGGGVFSVTHGRFGVWWQDASGSLKKNGDLMTPDATFETASISKTFTAAVILLLAEEGALELDQPIGQLLPAELTQGLLVIDGRDFGAEISVRQLLNHTSGLPDYWTDPPFLEPGVNAFLKAYLNDPNRFWQPSEILAYVRDLNPIAAPGQKWHYSDSGYVLAGLIIEQITAKPLHQVYRSRLFEPLGMENTWLQWREAPVGSHPRSHRYENDWDMYDKRHNSADWAGGGLASNAQDLTIFLRALAGKEIFTQPASQKAMQSWVATGIPDIEYGLGLFRILLDDNLGELWGHDGYGNAWMYYWPEQDVSFTGTLNQAENDWWPVVEAAIVQISEIMASDPCLSTRAHFFPFLAREDADN